MLRNRSGSKLIAPIVGRAGKIRRVQVDAGMIAMGQRLSLDVEWRLGDWQNLSIADGIFDMVDHSVQNANCIMSSGQNAAPQFFASDI